MIPGFFQNVRDMRIAAFGIQTMLRVPKSIEMESLLGIPVHASDAVLVASDILIVHCPNTIMEDAIFGNCTQSSFCVYISS